MDFDPLVRRLQATIEAVQLQGDVSVTQLAAEVRQVLLATTVDIEQRWQFLIPEDRVAALTDLIALTLIYKRAFADAVNTGDNSALDVGKALADAATLADQTTFGVDLLKEDALQMSDELTSLIAFVRQYEDSLEMADAIVVHLTLIRSFSDAATVNDIPSKAPTKAFSELGGLYVEAGYFADDYWQAEGPSPFDELLTVISKVVSESAVMSDAFGSVADYLRSYADAATASDASLLEPQLAKTDAVSLSEQTAFDVDTAYGDTASLSESAALSFVTQMQDLVAVAEEFARTVDYSRSLSDTAALTDAPAKTFTTAFSDIGGLYATTDYFDDDYVEEGTGPAVYDTFSYTLN